MADTNTETHNPGIKLINHKTTVVADYLHGLISLNANVGKFHFGNVIVRRDYEQMDQVMLVSGWASGFEPAFAGFVGRGMLTASIQGDMVSAPSAKIIMRTVKELHNSRYSDVLIIIPCGQSECLNFGLAYQRALNESIPVRLLCVADDVATEKPHRRAGGLSGVVLVQKVAGAMADVGLLVNEISAYLETVAGAMTSVSVCLQPHVNNKTKTESQAGGFLHHAMEIGVGLLGITQGNQMPMKTAAETARLIIAELTNDSNPRAIQLVEGTAVVLMVNNLGGGSTVEEAIFTNEILQQLSMRNVSVARVYVGSFITSLDTNGFTVTLLKVIDDQLLKYLDYPTDAPHWGPRVQLPVEKSLLEDIHAKVIPKPRLATIMGPSLSKSTANTVLIIMQFAFDALRSCEKQLNLIDAEAGDGDTGTRMKAGADELLTLLREKQYNLECPFNLLMALGKSMEGVGGLFGCLYSVMFEAAANWFSQLPELHIVGASDWMNALRLASDALQRFSTVQLGGNTLLDPLAACVDAFAEALDKGTTGLAAFGEGVCSAELTAQRTKLPHRRHPDAGAHAVGVWLRACYEGAKLRCEE